MLLGALLTGSLDPSGKYQAPLAAGCSPGSSGRWGGERCGKRLPETGRSFRRAAQRDGKLPIAARHLGPVRGAPRAGEGLAKAFVAREG